MHPIRAGASTRRRATDGVLQPLKIGVIAHLKHAVCEPFAGGLEMHTHALCRRLRERGHSVTLFAAEGTTDSGVEPQCLPTCLTGDNFPESFRIEHLTYRRLMTELASRPFDVIHNNSLHYLVVSMAARLEVPMVTLLHTPPFWEMEGSVRLSGGDNNLFVAVSPTLRRAWQPIIAVAEVVPNGIDLELFRFRTKPHEPAYLVWTGRIVPEKGLHVALQAAAALGMELRIAGPIADALYYAAEIAPRLGTTSRYLGHLPHEALVSVVAGAAACVFTPLWEEPYGLALVEALACGTPVAALAHGAVPDLLDESCGALAASDTPAALATAIGVAMTLSRAACRRRAECIGDSQAMVTRYESLYRRVIAERHAPAGRMLPATRGPCEANAADIAPDNASLIAFYARYVPLTSHALSCGAP